MEPITVALGAAAGAISGVVASLIAPWVQWGIEKRREQRAAKRDLLNKAREHVISRQVGATGFLRTAEYARLKPHLGEDVIWALENQDEAQDNMDDPGEFSSALRRTVLDDLTQLERRWKLI